MLKKVPTADKYLRYLTLKYCFIDFLNNSKIYPVCLAQISASGMFEHLDIPITDMHVRTFQRIADTTDNKVSQTVATKVAQPSGAEYCKLLL